MKAERRGERCRKEIEREEILDRPTVYCCNHRNKKLNPMAFRLKKK